MNNDKIRIALVDDDESFARALCRLLRVSGFEVYSYSSAEAFLVPTPLPQPDCLLLDLRLAGMSGFDLQRHLLSQGSRVPVIFLTVHDELEMRAEAARAEGVALLRKPVNASILLEALEKALELCGKIIPRAAERSRTDEPFV